MSFMFTKVRLSRSEVPQQIIVKTYKLVSIMYKWEWIGTIVYIASYTLAYCSVALWTAYLFWWNFRRINPKNIVRQHNPRNKVPDAIPTIRETLFSLFSSSSVVPIKREKLMCSFLTFYGVPIHSKNEVVSLTGVCGYLRYIYMLSWYSKIHYEI